MHNISALYADYLKRHDREFLVKATIGNKEYDNTKIVDFNIESSLTLSEEFEIGTTIPSKLTIRLRSGEAIPPNSRIAPYISLSLARMTWEEATIPWEEDSLPWVGGATEWLPLGEFFVDSRVKSNDVWVYTCYDKLVYADVPYVSSLTFPASQKAVFDEICGRLGYTYDSSIVINPTYMVPVAPSGFSMRQVLGYIAGCNSSSLFMGKDSTLKQKRFVPEDEPVFDLGLSDYIRARQTNPVKSYTRVVVTYDTEDDLTYEAGAGDENHTLYIENPLATQAITDALYNSLRGVSYLPLSMDARGFPQLEQGDKIGFGLYEGSVWSESVLPWGDTDVPWTGVVQHHSYVLNQVLSFKGGLQLKIEAPSLSEQQSEFVVEGTLTAQVNKLDKTAVKEGKHYYGTTITRFEGIKVQRDDGKSDLTLNSDIMDWRVDGQSQLHYDAIANRIKFSGTLEAADGIFSGDLYAVGGTFTGTLQGVDGIFTGDLEAVGGTFAGDLSAVGGTFTGTLVGVDGDFSGTITASEFIGGTVTGAKFQTSDTKWPRLVIDPSSVAFGVYADENNGVLIPAYDGGVSIIRFLSNGNESTIYNSPSLGLVFSGYSATRIIGSHIYLSATQNIHVPSWSLLYSDGANRTLQSELDAIWAALSGKANANHSHTVNLGSHNHGIGGAVNWGGTFTVS